MKKAILFDLDGTLLPMDADAFVKLYFGSLAERLAPLGYNPQQFVKTMWKGVKAMFGNDGTMTNEERFWKTYAEDFGDRYQEELPIFEDYYRNEFHRAKAACGENPLVGQIITAAHEKAEKVILATNPLFPPVAVESRLSWIGLKPDDFDMITTYDRFCSSKPNPAYFREILQQIGASPEECLMIGNDEQEDMWSAGQVGIEGYLVTDCLIPYEKCPHAGKRGTAAEMLAWLRGL